MIVVDASVAVKWFVPEQDSDKASAILRSDQRLLAPDLIRIEVAATFTRLLRMGDIDITKAQTLLDKWRYYVVQQAIALEQVHERLMQMQHNNSSEVRGNSTPTNALNFLGLALTSDICILSIR